MSSIMLTRAAIIRGLREARESVEDFMVRLLEVAPLAKRERVSPL